MIIFGILTKFSILECIFDPNLLKFKALKSLLLIVAPKFFQKCRLLSCLTQAMYHSRPKLGQYGPQYTWYGCTKFENVC